MIKPHIIEPSFQRTRGTHGDSDPKDWGLKAFMRMYRNHQLSIGVGLPSKIPRLINMNSWLKLRDKNAAKCEMMSLILRQRSPTKQALVLGTHGGKSCDSSEQTAPRVKREPTEFVLRLSLGTLETFIPAFGEMEDKIGSKRTPRVILGIKFRNEFNQKWCPLPVALLEMDV